MKTIDPRDQKATSTTRTREAHPEIQSAPSRTGVLGTILTELDFGEDERGALAMLGTWLAQDLDEIIHCASSLARRTALAAEGFGGGDPLAAAPLVRPSIRNLRKHAARQWLHGTLAGNYDSSFSRQLRHTWMPILLAEPHQTRATPELVRHFLDYLEGYAASRIVDEVAPNIVPHWRMLHALRIALDVQRRIFGIERA